MRHKPFTTRQYHAYTERMKTNDVINRAVYAHLSRERRTQVELARLIGLPQSSLSLRLHGARTWHTKDIDALVAIGVLEPLRAAEQ